jgi:hypothetical protein
MGGVGLLWWSWWYDVFASVVIVAISLLRFPMDGHGDDDDAFASACYV